MKLILSPTKTMRPPVNCTPCKALPRFLEQSGELLAHMRSFSQEELKALWKCSDVIAAQNAERFQTMDLQNHLTPAVLTYEGLVFQHMAPDTWTQTQMNYIQNHLYILSGFYGVLKPLDGIVPYRLDLEDKVRPAGCKDLYAFWGKVLYEAVLENENVVINLASKEYAKAIEKYLKPEDTFITCSFVEQVKGKLVQKATFSKMARGEMVRYLAKQQTESPTQMKQFNRLGFRFREELSSQTEYVFERMAE